ncbi:unnamed protein product [Peronospora destructor]|uniref:Uncharacterized protein n=1 Tax=Peronospora destructor TaxID=86335 RepID=A0AAV0T4E5_9STRA|nr:unnamed protein product [Peronospora destructor]
MAFTGGDNALGFRVRQSFEDVMQSFIFLTENNVKLPSNWLHRCPCLDYRKRGVKDDDHHTIGLPALPNHFRLKLKLSAQCIAAFYRNGFEADGTALALGTLTKNVKVIRGFQSIQETLEGASILALRDYWEWWSAQAENGQYGKLLLIDEKKAEMNGDSAVFFDDHIDANHSHIVDVRDVRSGASIDFEKSCGKYLQRVQPIAAITDPNYFISLLEKHVV